MRGRVNAIRTFKGLVADLREDFSLQKMGNVFLRTYMFYRYIRIALWYDVYLCSVLGSFIVSRTH